VVLGEVHVEVLVGVLVEALVEALVEVLGVVLGEVPGEVLVVLLVVLLGELLAAVLAEVLGVHLEEVLAQAMIQQDLLAEAHIHQVHHQVALHPKILQLVVHRQIVPRRERRQKKTVKGERPAEPNDGQATRACWAKRACCSDSMKESKVNGRTFGHFGRGGIYSQSRISNTM